MVQTLGTTPLPANDIYINPSGNLAILQSESAVEAACQSTSLLQLGEAVLSITSGLPYFQAVWNGIPNIAVFESYLRTAILNVTGVVSITSLTTSVSGNVLSYSVTIQSVYGEVEIVAEELQP